MFDEHAEPASTSLTGLLSSVAFGNLIASSIDVITANISLHLRLLVEFSAVLYCGNGQTAYAGLQPFELWDIHAYVGTKVLQMLDMALGAASSGKLSFEHLKGLFLALVATIIAVGYSGNRNCIANVGLDCSLHRKIARTDPISGLWT